jgi:hypothetical protein
MSAFSGTIALAARAHMHPAQVFGLGAEGRVGLHRHAVGAAGLVEVVHVQRTHLRLQRANTSASGTPSASAFSRSTSTRSCGTSGAEEGGAGRQLGPRVQALHEGLRDLRQALRIGVGAALHVDLEAAGLPQALDGGRVEGEGHAVGQRHEAHAD